MTKNKKSSKNKSKAALAVAAERRKEQLINESHLAFPIKSRYHEIGKRLLAADPSNPRNKALALDAYLRGSRTDGCVRCMHQYHWHHENIHGANMMQLLVRLPWLFEAAIRGDYTAIAKLSYFYFDNGQQQATSALNYYWGKRARILHPQLPSNTKEILKNFKEHQGDRCAVCNTPCCDDPRALIQCSGCSYYCYCSKEHQIEHWNTWNHRGECKQLQILNTYHKPYAKQIHRAILLGDEPATIRELQLLRTKLGLNRPTEDYEKMNIEEDDTEYAPPADGNNNSRQAVSLGQPNQRLQTATAPTTTAAAATAVVSPPFKDNAITFAIVDQIGHELWFRVRPHLRISTAFNVYSQRQEIPYFPKIYFQTEDGEHISPDATPGMIGLKENSRIYCINPTDKVEQNEGGTDTAQDNDSNNNDGHIKRFVARNDGTVHIGSTPEMI